MAKSLVQHVLRTRLYLLLLVCFVFSLGLSAIVPLLPSLATNFFASRHAGFRLDCEQFDVADQPLPCQEAHSDVVFWTSLNSLAANTCIAFLFAPLMGDLSDTWGRRPFIIAGIALSMMPVGAVWLHLCTTASLLWYYPLNALTAAVSPVVAMLSYAADVLPPEQRTSGFGLITAAFSVGYVVGPALCSVLQPHQTAMVAGAALLVALLLVVVAVPESRPAAAPAAAAAPGVLTPSPAAAATAATSHRRRGPCEAFVSLGRSWRLINSSSLFRRLALCMAVVGIVSEGIQDMLLQYLQLTVGFNTADTTLLIMLLGAGNFLVQALLLPLVTPWLGERRLLLVGLFFSITEQALLSLATTKGQAVAAVSLSAFAGVSFPAISSLKSTHASADQQGLVQGALAGIRALSSGLGPLGLAQLFAWSTTAEAVLGYHPALVFMTTCALTVVAAAVAASIPDDAAKLPRPPGDYAHGSTATAAAGAPAAAAAGPGRGCSCAAAPAWMSLNDIESDCHKASSRDDQAGAGAEAALNVAGLAGCAGGPSPAALAVHEAAAEAAAAHSNDDGGAVLLLVVAPDGDGPGSSSSAGPPPSVWRQAGGRHGRHRGGPPACGVACAEALREPLLPQADIHADIHAVVHSGSRTA